MPRRRKTQVKEKAYLFSLKMGLGSPPGYRFSYAHFFARYKQHLWEVVLESLYAHEHFHHSGEGAPHAVCGLGSVIFGDQSALTHLGEQLAAARQAESPLARALEQLIPRGRRIESPCVNIVIGNSDIDWQAAEDSVMYLMGICGCAFGDLEFVWIDRDDAAEEEFYRARLNERMQWLAAGAPPPIERITPDALAGIAKQNDATLEEAKEHFAGKGFEEQEDGTLLKKPPAVNHGVEEAFEARLTAAAKELGYTGELLLSPASWPTIGFVAGGQFCSYGNDEHRAWFGYLKDARTLLLLFLDRSLAPEIHELPGDPDFLAVMKPVVSRQNNTPVQ